MDYVEALGDALGWDALTRMSVSENLRFAVEEAEAEIARRGLLAQRGYIKHLLLALRSDSSAWEITQPDSSGGMVMLHDIFMVLTAPPEVRARAMLKVLE